MQSSSSYNRILYQILTNYIVLLLCNMHFHSVYSVDDFRHTCTMYYFPTINLKYKVIHIIFFFISCTVPMVKIGSRSRFWRRAVFRCYYLVFKSQDLFLIYKNDLTRRNDLFYSVLFISSEFDSIFKKLKCEE